MMIVIYSTRVAKVPVHDTACGQIVPGVLSKAGLRWRPYWHGGQVSSARGNGHLEALMKKMMYLTGVGGALYRDTVEKLMMLVGEYALAKLPSAASAAFSALRESKVIPSRV